MQPIDMLCFEKKRFEQLNLISSNEQYIAHFAPFVYYYL